MLFCSSNAHLLCRAFICSVPFIYIGCAQTALVGDDFINLDNEGITEVNRLPSAEKLIEDPSISNQQQHEIIPDEIPDWLYGIDCDGPPGGEVFAGLDTVLHGAPVPPPEHQIFTLGPISDIQLISPEDSSSPALALHSETQELLYLGIFCGEITSGEFDIVSCDAADDDCNYLCPDVMHSYVGPSDIHVGKSGTVIIDETEGCLAGRFKIQYGNHSNRALSGWFRAKTLPTTPWK